MQSITKKEQSKRKETVPQKYERESAIGSSEKKKRRVTIAYKGKSKEESEGEVV